MNQCLKNLRTVAFALAAGLVSAPGWSAVQTAAEDSTVSNLSVDVYGFDGAARTAISQWRYHPCRKEGLAITAWYTIVVDFVLSDSETMPSA